MEQNERKQPGSPGQGKARHGYQNEVSWDGGQGGQPYTNQQEEHGPAAAHETEAGNRGAASGRNLEQFEQLRGFPGERESEAAREGTQGDGGVS
jgi:hypothetical protein